jgi:RNA polymerase sigma-70 factor (ECF subfamily)
MNQAIVENQGYSTEIDEKEAVKNCKAGNLEYFDFLYETYITKIYNFVFYKTHHKETAEDLTSQIFMKALENITSFKDQEGFFSAWIFRIARNLVIDYYRKSKASYNIEDGWDLKSNEDLFKETSNKVKLDKVRDYLKNFDAIQRDIVILRVWNELSYKEISKVIGKSEANCKMIFSRIISKVKKEFIYLFFIEFFKNI